VARPTRAEAQLSLGGLADLITDLPAEAAVALPEIQQRALAVVRAEEGLSAEGIDAHVIAAAFLGLLRALSAEQPVALAVDDIQWLDESSAAAVVFALRRLRSEDVRLLVSCRGAPGAPLPFELERLAEPLLLRLAIGPLSEGALHRLLHQRLGVSLSRPLLHAVHETSGGNPFFALELVRAGIEVAEDGSIELPKSLDSLVQARLARLPLATQRSLAYVAALSEPTLGVLARCDDVAAGLEPAVAAGVLTLERGRLRFDHPLLGAAAWSAAEPAQRRAVHRTLAEATEDPEERARHLALATEQPDAAVADALYEAATRARQRGATLAAAELLEQALRLTPAEEHERWLRAAVDLTGAQHELGELDKPLELVEQTLARLPAGPERASLLIAAADMRQGSLELCRQAVAEAGDTPTGARALMSLSDQCKFSGDWTGSVANAEAACELAVRLGDKALEGATRSFLGLALLEEDDLRGRDEIRRAREIESELGSPIDGPEHLPAAVVAAHAAVWCDDDHEFPATVFEPRLQELLGRGDEHNFDVVAVDFAAYLLDTGDWQRARDLIEQCLRSAELGDARYSWSPHVLGLIDALEGNLTRAREQIEAGFAHNLEVGDEFGQSQCHAALAIVDFCAGNSEAALEHLEARHAFMGENLAIARLPRVDMIELEALVLTGRHEQAERLVDRLRELGETQSRPRFLACAAWGKGLLRAAHGDLQGAQAALEQALDRIESVDFPLERARIRLSYGQVLRRSKQRKAARDVLSDTLGEFERLGARHFAQVTRDELARVGGRTPAAEGELTPTEERVARLVAQGLSNKEVAARLFVTVRTVEATLTRIYAKLSVRSRLLGRAMGSGPTEGLSKRALIRL
ncbi:MAG: ATP-binding protein, partial [Gaiellaceae bacterium]